MKLNKEIFYLAIPNIISNISVPLMSSVDTGLMGRIGTVHIAAIGMSSMLFNLLYWNFGFLRMGTTGMVAQAFGAKDNNALQSVVSKSLLLAIIISIIILITQQIFFSFGIEFLSVKDDHFDIVKRYFNVRIFDAPATLMLYALMGIFFGMQNALVPLLITISINVVNIALSYYLVSEWQLNVEGVAWGTVIAQYMGCLVSYCVLRFHYKQSFDILTIINGFSFSDYLGFLKINGNIFIRTVSMTIVFGLLYRYCSDRGGLILASSVILLQLINWMSYGVDGFAYAAESLVGKYKGAGDFDKLKIVISLTLVWGAIIASLYSIIYWVMSESVISLFTNDLDLINYALQYRWLLCLIPILGCGAYIWDGIFVGLVESKGMRDSMLVSLLVFLVTYYSLPNLELGLDIWYAFTAFLAVRGIMQWLIYRIRIK